MAYKGNLNNVKLIVGRSNSSLGELVSQKLGIKPLDGCLDKFSNGEIKVEFYENIRNGDVFILQTGSSDSKNSINDYLMELFAIVDTCVKSSARTITVLLPCYPYARSDKKDNPRVPIMGSVVFRTLESIGVTRIVSLDLHSGQIQGFGKIPCDNLFAIGIHIGNLNNTYFNDMAIDELNRKYVLVSPDNGGTKRIEAYAKILKLNFVTMHKQRDYSKSSTILKTILIGDARTIIGKTAIIIDDMVDTMGTMIAVANQLERMGVKEVIIIASHGIFSGAACERINKCNIVEKVIVTNSIDQTDHKKKSNKIEDIDISELFSETIKRLVTGGSLSELFCL